MKLDWTLVREAREILKQGQKSKNDHYTEDVLKEAEKLTSLFPKRPFFLITHNYIRFSFNFWNRFFKKIALFFAIGSK